MPFFKLHLRSKAAIERDEFGLECPDLHHAYLEAYKAIPETAGDLLVEGQDPMECAYIICDASGRSLLEVPFTEVLSPSEWRLRRPRDAALPRSKEPVNDCSETHMLVQRKAMDFAKQVDQCKCLLADIKDQMATLAKYAQ